MNLQESIRMALDGLRSNKMRSILTMLGIIIGIASVISILTVGKSMSATVTDSFNALGSSNVFYFVSTKNTNDQMIQTSLNEPKGDDLISDDMIERLRTRFGDQVSGIGLSETLAGGQLKNGRLYANVNVQGANADIQPLNNIKMLHGRFVQDRDVTGSRNIAVISDKAVKNLFKGNPQDALGKEVNLYSGNDIRTFTVVGIYKFEENPMMSAPQTGSEKDLSTSIYIPISTAKNMGGKDPGYSAITISVAKGYDVSAVDGQVTSLLNEYYVNNPTFHVQSQSMEGIAEQMKQLTGTVSIALSVIAGISLLVGGIGVMNIMLVSVTERTREIGIRKALGATNNAIRQQFIVESIIVCLIGGVIGILLGGTMGFIGSKLLGAGTLPGIGSILVSVTFSLSIGVFFGFYPANKAAKLNPIDALRYE